MARILIADTDPTTADALDGPTAPDEHAVVRATNGDAARRAIDAGIELIVAEVDLPGTSGFELLDLARRRRPPIPVVLVTAFGSVEDAVHAVQAGAAEFLTKPLTAEQVRVTVERGLERARLERENRDLKRALEDRFRIDDLIATDDRMLRVFKVVRAAAQTRSTVLITGESGTGKTLLARAIHDASGRAGPFVEVNCGALPENLLESELFGHVRGAFTGAVKDRPGKFEAADGGTIFLDEIGTSSPALQVKLLRVLQDRVVERVGDSRTIPIDVRVILATNLDLAAEVRAGRFREDLYYRIHVISVEMPPLRERRSDIPLLAEHFLHRFRASMGKQLDGFTRAALARLTDAPWPGNIRQLENVVERAVVLCEGGQVDVEDLPPDLTPPTDPGGDLTPESLVPDRAHLLPLREALEAPERAIIERALEHHGGNRQRTADSLGINRSTLFNKMRKFGLS